MVNTRDAIQVLDHDFLETRCKILEIAAILDRIDRARRGTESIPTCAWASCGGPSRRCSSPGRGGPRPSSAFFRSNMIRAGANG